jgi:hypothetical protein
MVASEGFSPLTDPEESLLRLGAECEAVSVVLRERVARLTDITITDRTGAQDVTAELQAYERSLDRLGRLLVAINKLGLAERTVHIERRKADLLSQVVTRAIWSAHADLDFETGQRVLQAVAAELRALPTEAWE